MKNFIFGGDTGETAQSLASKRQKIDALMNRLRTDKPHGVADSIRHVGESLVGNYREKKLDEKFAKGQGEANTLFASLLTGGQDQIASPSPSYNPFAPQPSSDTVQINEPNLNQNDARINQAFGEPQSPAPQLSGGKDEFIQALLPAAIEEGKRTGVDPRIIVAQAAQETGWGKSAPGNNFFGIKSHGKSGGQNFTTHEVINGQRVKINDNFRQYASPTDSVRGYGEFLLQNPRYEGLRNAQGLDNQLNELQASGYATDPNYAKSVGSIARSIQLPQGTPQQAINQQAPQQTAQAQPQPQQTAQSGVNPQLVEALSNPYLSEQQRQIIGGLVQQQLAAQAPKQPLTALEQARIQKLQAETDNLRNPQAKPTDDIREYQFAKSQGFEGTFNEYQTKLKEAGRTSVNVGGEGDKFYQELDKNNAVTYSKLSENGINSRSKLAQVNQLEQLLNSSGSGFGAILAQRAGEFGIETDGLSEIQAAQALINKLVPEQRQPGSGPMSDADLALFKQSLPRLINTPEGNTRIIEGMRGIAEYEIRMGEIADLVANRDLSPSEGRDEIRKLPNPLDALTKKIKSEKNSTKSGVEWSVN